MQARRALSQLRRVSRTLALGLPVWLVAVLTGAPRLAAQDTPSGAAEPPSPIAIVPIADASQSQVTGVLQINKGSVYILSSGAITSGSATTSVVLPRRGTLRVCASTTVKLASDTSVPAGETPGLMIALDHGAVEASFAIGSNSDILLTPDFRILLGGPGSSEVKVRLGQHGDTCIDNPGANAPYVVVSSVFEGGAYRVQPGQRVMLQHGNLHEVVDQEKEPCGCPPETRPNSNDFPLDQSAGLAPLAKPTPAPAPAPQPLPPTVEGKPPEATIEPLVYSAPQAQKAPEAASAQPVPGPSIAQPSPVPAAPPEAHHKSGFFHSIGHFFHRIFGAE